MTDIAQHDPRIVVVGAGPSGCFIAGALRRSLPRARILVVDQLPCPFGLVRYGVAADHQSTKNITRQFDRIFTRERVEFAGNVSVTRTARPGAVSLDQLRASADAVVLATGLAADKPLGVPGDRLAGVLGSGALTGLLNSHPESRLAAESLAELGDHVAIVGIGNVAIDIIRFLAKSDADFAGSDINDDALRAYSAARVQSIDVCSRSPIEAVKCDAQMVRELAQISGLRVSLHGDTGVDEATIGDRTQAARVAAIRDLAASADADDARIELRLHFGVKPVRVEGAERVERLVTAERDGAERTIAVESVIAAIGFAAEEDCIAGTIGEIRRSDPASGRIEPGLYRVGWLRRGPRGTIPENRADAMCVADEIIADLTTGALETKTHELPEELLPADVADASISYDDWLAIDRHERETAPDDRTRAKVRSIDRMLAVARERAHA